MVKKNNRRRLILSIIGLLLISVPLFLTMVSSRFRLFIVESDLHLEQPKVTSLLLPVLLKDLDLASREWAEHEDKNPDAQIDPKSYFGRLLACLYECSLRRISVNKTLAIQASGENDQGDADSDFADKSEDNKSEDNLLEEILDFSESDILAQVALKLMLRSNLTEKIEIGNRVGESIYLIERVLERLLEEPENPDLWKTLFVIQPDMVLGPPDYQDKAIALQQKLNRLEMPESVKVLSNLGKVYLLNVLNRGEKFGGETLFLEANEVELVELIKTDPEFLIIFARFSDDEESPWLDLVDQESGLSSEAQLANLIDLIQLAFPIRKDRSDRAEIDQQKLVLTNAYLAFQRSLPNVKIENSKVRAKIESRFFDLGFQSACHNLTVEQSLSLFEKHCRDPMAQKNYVKGKSEAANIDLYTTEISMLVADLIASGQLNPSQQQRVVKALGTLGYATADSVPTPEALTASRCFRKAISILSGSFNAESLSFELSLPLVSEKQFQLLPAFRKQCLALMIGARTHSHDEKRGGNREEKTSESRVESQLSALMSEFQAFIAPGRLRAHWNQFVRSHSVLALHSLPKNSAHLSPELRENLTKRAKNLSVFVNNAEKQLRQFISQMPKFDQVQIVNDLVISANPLAPKAGEFREEIEEAVEFSDQLLELNDYESQFLVGCHYDWDFLIQRLISKSAPFFDTARLSEDDDNESAVMNVQVLFQRLYSNCPVNVKSVQSLVDLTARSPWLRRFLNSVPDQVRPLLKKELKARSLSGWFSPDKAQSDPNDSDVTKSNATPGFSLAEMINMGEADVDVSALEIQIEELGLSGGIAANDLEYSQTFAELRDAGIFARQEFNVCESFALNGLNRDEPYLISSVAMAMVALDPRGTKAIPTFLKIIRSKTATDYDKAVCLCALRRYAYEEQIPAIFEKLSQELSGKLVQLAQVSLERIKAFKVRRHSQ